MICRNCGNIIPDGSSFCDFCGAAALQEDPAQSEDEKQKELESFIAACETPPSEEGTPSQDESGETAEDEETKKKPQRWQILGIICLIILIIAFAFGGNDSDDTNEDAAEAVDIEVGAASEPQEKTTDVTCYEDGTVQEETIVEVYENYTITFIYSYDENGLLTGYISDWEDGDSTSIITVYDENELCSSVEYQDSDSSYTTTYEYEFDEDGGIIWMYVQTFGTDSDGADYLDQAEYEYEEGLPVSWDSDDMSEHTDYYYYLYNETYDYWGVYIISRAVNLDGYTLIGEITYNDDGSVDLQAEDGYEWVMHGDGLWPEKI